MANGGIFIYFCGIAPLLYCAGGAIVMFVRATAVPASKMQMVYYEKTASCIAFVNAFCRFLRQEEAAIEIAP